MNQKTINLNYVNTWDDFHDIFYREFHFPSYYGRNMNAWIDCMEEYGVSNGFLVLNLIGMIGLKEGNREVYDAINECSAFINFRNNNSQIQAGILLRYGND